MWTIMLTDVFISIFFHFSRQAMGRSRTMNFTRFVIYFNRCGPGHEDGKIGAAGSSDPAGVSESAAGDASEPQRAQIQSSGVDIKSHPLVRELYVTCVSLCFRAVAALRQSFSPRGASTRITRIDGLGTCRTATRKSWAICRRFTRR
jgi:hypothetical protein